MSAGLAGQDGSGLLGSALGIGIFLVLMLLSAHVLTYLYVAAVVEASTYDAAVHAAAAGGDPVAAEKAARSSLGDLGSRTVFDWGASDDDEIVLRVVVSRPNVLGTRFTESLGLGTVEREARARVEQLR